MEIYKNLLLEDLNGEIWKEIDGYDGDYFVSNFGRVKSFKIYKEGEILKIRKYENGHLYIVLSKNKKHKHKSVHRLVYETFNNYKLKNNECVHHIDENKENNYYGNLKKMTKYEHNSFHNKGKKNPNFGIERPGEKSGNHILKEKDVIEIWKHINEGILTQKEIGRLFGVNGRTISNIKCGTSWKHINKEIIQCQIKKRNKKI